MRIKGLAPFSISADNFLPLPLSILNAIQFSKPIYPSKPYRPLSVVHEGQRVATGLRFQSITDFQRNPTQQHFPPSKSDRPSAPTLVQRDIGTMALQVPGGVARFAILPGPRPFPL